MTTHLEYYSQAIRHEQARALRALHGQYNELAMRPPRSEAAGPYQLKPHTSDAILCGDFNFESDSPEYASVVGAGAHPLIQAWECLHPGKTYPATFRLYDRTYGPEPVACDFFFVSESLSRRVSRVAVNQDTKVSDHQPVLLELKD
jgi:endonuclease/exonuclease/phosphatase family metal-dependent hydrolase